MSKKEKKSDALEKQYDPKVVDAIRGRRFKVPFELIYVRLDTGNEIVLPDGNVKKQLTLCKFKVEKMSDIHTFDQMCRSGLIAPIPQLGLQVLNIFMDFAGLVEDPEPVKK